MLARLRVRDPLAVALMVSWWLPRRRHHAATHVIQRQEEERPSARALVPLLLEEGFFSPQKSPTDERANACVLRSRPALLEGSQTQTPARAPRAPGVRGQGVVGIGPCPPSRRPRPQEAVV